MKIIADENIPCVEKAFASLGDVVLLPGRDMRRAQVRDADILLVRSVTRVDQALLEGSSIRFVGSATIGFDHVDRDYLKQQGIGFSTAPGCNATSAAEYVVSALMAISERKDFSLSGKSVGIIGCGNVGSRVRGKLAALGMTCMINDPPRAAAGDDDTFVELDEALQADIVTLHVPLSNSGAHPTYHLVDAAALQKLKPGAVVINTSRGAVVDNHALNALLEHRDDLSVILDVWEDEPAINVSLLEKVDLGTPHIAGYSLDGKLRGTDMIYRAACEYSGERAQWDVADDLPAGPSLNLDAATHDDMTAMLRSAVLGSYDVRADDARLRELPGLSPTDRPLYFDRLRKEYPVRREFSETRVMLDGPADDLESVLCQLGFPVAVCA
jgi:erythronate-4-phosphate dehydrogenase